MTACIPAECVPVHHITLRVNVGEGLSVDKHGVRHYLNILKKIPKFSLGTDGILSHPLFQTPVTATLPCGVTHLQTLNTVPPKSCRHGMPSEGALAVV